MNKLFCVIFVLFALTNIFAEKSFSQRLENASKLYGASEREGIKQFNLLLPEIEQNGNWGTYFKVGQVILDDAVINNHANIPENFPYNFYQNAIDYGTKDLAFKAKIYIIEILKIKEDWQATISATNQLLNDNDFNLIYEHKLIDLTIDLGKFYINNHQYNAAINHCKNLLLDLKGHLKQSNIAKINMILAQAYYQKGMNRSSINYFEKTLNYAEKNNQLDFRMDILLQIGNAYDNIGEFDKALKSYYAALENIPKNLNNDFKAKLYDKVAKVYRQLGQYNQASTYLSKAQIINISNENWLQVADNYYNLGKIYELIPYRNASIQYYQKALKIYNDNNFPSGIVKVSTAFANLYIEMNDEDKSIEYAKIAMQQQENLQNQNLFPQVYLTNSRIMLSIDNFAEAERSANLALNLAQEMNMSEEIQNSYLMLAKIYEKSGNLQKSLDNYKNFEATKDAINQALSHETLAEMQTLHSFFEKEKKIEKLNNSLIIEKISSKNQRLISMILVISSIILIVIILITFKYYRNTKELYSKMKKQKIQLEKAYSQLNEAHKEKVELEKLRAAMALNVTLNHELNQPLMIIQGNIEMLSIKIEDSGKIQKYLSRIQESIDRIDVILKKLKSIKQLSFKKYANREDMIDIEDKKEVS